MCVIVVCITKCTCMVYVQIRRHQHTRVYTRTQTCGTTPESSSAPACRVADVHHIPYSHGLRYVSTVRSPQSAGRHYSTKTPPYVAPRVNLT